MRKSVSDLDLTTTQAAALRELTEPRTQTELANRLACEPSNVTFVIDKLEKRGLVRRAPHPTDRRVKVLHLTPNGASVRAQMIDTFEESSPLNRLSARELTQLESLLAKAVDRPG